MDKVVKELSSQAVTLGATTRNNKNNRMKTTHCTSQTSECTRKFLGAKNMQNTNFARTFAIVFATRNAKIIANVRSAKPLYYLRELETRVCGARKTTITRSTSSRHSCAPEVLTAHICSHGKCDHDLYRQTLRQSRCAVVTVDSCAEHKELTGRGRAERGEDSYQHWHNTVTGVFVNAIVLLKRGLLLLFCTSTMYYYSKVEGWKRVSLKKTLTVTTRTRTRDLRSRRAML